jgi:hypothetical protein
VEKEYVKALLENCEKNKQKKYEFENYAKSAFSAKDR